MGAPQGARRVMEEGEWRAEGVCVCVCVCVCVHTRGGSSDLVALQGALEHENIALNTQPNLKSPLI
jgi:hypothetical protein